MTDIKSDDGHPRNDFDSRRTSFLMKRCPSSVMGHDSCVCVSVSPSFLMTDMTLVSVSL